MSKIEKLIHRLHSKPKDFTWDEMKKVLKHYHYEEISSGITGGSRRRFVNPKNIVISLHEPHPARVLKRYQLDIVIEHLKKNDSLV